MAPGTPFPELMAAVRAGDEAAAAELVEWVQPELLPAIQTRLRRLQLDTQLEPADVCQSVLGKFFHQVAQGQYPLEDPHELIKLLVRMAGNQVLDEAKKRRTGRRDRRREARDPPENLDSLPGRSTTPSKIVGGQEIVDQMLHRLTKEERYILEQRNQGREWADLATELETSADTLRKRLARAVDRVTREAGLGGTDLGLPL